MRSIWRKRWMMVASLATCVVGVSAQNNPYNINDTLYPLFQQTYKYRFDAQGLELADSLRREAIRLGDREAELAAMSVPVYYHCYSDISFEQFRHDIIDPLLEKAEAYDIQRYYYFGQSNIITFLNYHKRYMEALDYAQRQLKAAVARRHHTGVVIALRTLGNVHMLRGEHVQAIDYFQQSIDYAGQYLTKLDISQSYLNLIRCYRKLGDFEGMLSTSLAGLERIKNNADSRYLLNMNRCYAYFLLGRDEDFKAMADTLQRPNAELPATAEVVIRAVEVGQKTLRGESEEQVMPLIDAIDRQYEHDKLLLCAAFYKHRGEEQKTWDYLVKLLRLRHDLDEENVLADQHEMEQKIGAAQREVEHQHLDRQNTQLQLENARLQLRNSTIELDQSRTAMRLASLTADQNEMKLIHQRLSYRQTQDSLRASLMRHDTESRLDRLDNHRLMVILGIIALIALVAMLTWLDTLRRSLRVKNSNSQLMQHNAELEEAQRKALKAEQMKTRFIQNMSHEIRTPLNAIVGFSQVLTEQNSQLTVEEKKEIHHEISDNSTQLTSAVDSILRLASEEIEKTTKDNKA